MWFLGLLFWFFNVGIILHVGQLILVEHKLWLATRHFAGMFIFNAFQCSIIGHFFFGVPFEQSFPLLLSAAYKMPAYAWKEFLAPAAKAALGG